jgi:hypothetical protein
MRLRDDELRKLADSRQARIAAMAKECLEARERGTMPTVDLATQLSANRIPTNMTDGVYVPAEGEGAVSVCAWTPEKDGKGKTTQVHLVFDLGVVFGDDSLPKLVHRMKSGPGVDQMIRLLAEYRGEVWPNYQGVRVSR